MLSRNLFILAAALLLSFTANAQDITFVQTGGPYGGSTDIVASPDGTLFLKTPAGWFRSLDDGESWQGLPGHLDAIWASPENGIFAGGPQGAFVSFDRGNNWTRVGFDGGTVHEVLADSTGRLWVRSDSVYTSIDGGASWINFRATIADFETPHECGSLKLASDDSGTVYVVAYHCAFFFGFYLFRWDYDQLQWKRDLDVSGIPNKILKDADGITWVAASVGQLLGDGVVEHSSSTVRVLGGLSLLLPGFNDGHILSGQPGGVRVSTDGGASWTVDAGSSFPATSLSRGTDGSIYAGSSGYCLPDISATEQFPVHCFPGAGLFRRSTSEARWSRVDTAPTYGAVLALVAGKQGLWAATYNGLFNLDRHTQNWETAVDGSGGPFGYFRYQYPMDLFEAASGDVFVHRALWWSSLFRLSPPDSTLREMTDSFYALQTGIFVSESGSVITILYGDTWRLDDDGVSWDRVHYDPFISMVECDTLLVGSFRSGTWSSHDEGRSWSKSEGSPREGTIAASNDNGRLVLFTPAASFESFDCGNNWTRIGEHPEVTQYVIDTDGNVFGATASNVVASFWGPEEYDTQSASLLVASYDGGVSWDTLDTSAITGNITAIALDKYNYLYLGTDRSGVWRSRERTAVGVDDEQPTPPAASVDVYPNPFSEQATIRLSTEQPDHVRVEVFDMLGRLVYVVADGDLPRGLHEIRINGQPLASGLYLVRVTMGRDVLSRKLVRR